MLKVKTRITAVGANMRFCSAESLRLRRVNVENKSVNDRVQAKLMQLLSTVENNTIWEQLKDNI